MRNFYNPTVVSEEEVEAAPQEAEAVDTEVAMLQRMILILMEMVAHHILCLGPSELLSKQVPITEMAR
ncbi:hypothetical protein X975_22235, partial [Stegodyphus mimosarum]